MSHEEVESYIRATANVDPAGDLLARIYRETEGNPFFLSEVVALMTQEGAMQRGSEVRLALPESVREVLGRRLDRLSEECNELLTLAAVTGREFTYELLESMTEHEAEPLLLLVEEALDGRVVEEAERAGEYRFNHALIQETLLGEVSTTRRVSLHGRIAEALEGLSGSRAERIAAELSHYFLESSTHDPRPRWEGGALHPAGGRAGRGRQCLGRGGPPLRELHCHRVRFRRRVG